MAGLLSAIEMAIIKRRRKMLSRGLFAKYHGTVQNGIFKGMRFAGHPNVSKAAYGLKIFGLYEAEVTNQLSDWSPADTLVDLGAGDGYYAVGMLRSGMVKRAICFEMTSSGRKEIQSNADLNGVGDKITILGKADAGVVEQLGKLNLVASETLLLCDIEGAEFDIIKRPLIEQLRGARFIIELHDTLWQDDDGAARSKLLAEFPQQYDLRIIRDAARNWNGINELEAMHDLDRALVTSEGRKILGEWLVAEIA